MRELPDRSVHLMVTSPPYNVGKDYDEDLTMDDYRGLLRRVLAETFECSSTAGAPASISPTWAAAYIPFTPT